MLHTVQIIKTFPSVQIPSVSGGAPVEVSLIAQLGHGAGNHLCMGVMARQQRHDSFVDELDEPSAKLAAAHFQKGDPSSLYSFVVGAKGHPFHCHAGNRMFMAVSGSGGAQLRFSTASMQMIHEEPRSFLEALRYVNIPPDSMFTVRFGPRVWHRFAPLSASGQHPAFFALSYHADELSGELSEALKQKVMANEATVPALTELLPEAVTTLMQSDVFDDSDIPTTTLALDAAAGTLKRRMCNGVRGSAGVLRGAWAKIYISEGFLSEQQKGLQVKALQKVPEDSLLRLHLADKLLHHEDTYTCTVKAADCPSDDPETLLAMLLDAFLTAPPRSIGWLMTVRNLLVRPLELRTSSLGCPVSSLLAENPEKQFAGKYPVLDHSLNPARTHAQVLLGADDKHLLFRSAVGVKMLTDRNIEFSLGNRVHCTNAFGRFYIAVIDGVHRHYVVPTMLRAAVNTVLKR